MANYKKFITLLLIFSIHMFPFNSAWALTTVRDWSITNVTRQGATTNLSASKSIIIDGNVINKTSTATIKPTPKQVANMLKGGVAGAALSVAVSALIGAVEWVLDPANNQIVYKNPTQIPDSPDSQFYYQIPYNGYNTQKFSTPNQACRYAYNSGLGDVVKPSFPYYSHTANGMCYLTSVEGQQGTFVFSDVIKVANPSYDPNAEQQPQENTLPLETVAQKVISNADAGDIDAQVATGAAADEALANDPQTQTDVENQLNTNSKTQTNEQASGDTTPKDPAQPQNGTDINLKFPVFCTWAPLVCEAAQTAINFPKTITQWYTSTKTAFTEAYDFAKTKVQEFSDIFKDEQQTDTELEFNDPTDDITDTSVSFSSSCPPPIVLADFNFHGIPIHWELDFSAWCDSLSTYLKPIVISMASFSAVLILAGVRENG